MQLKVETTFSFVQQSIVSHSVGLLFLLRMCLVVTRIVSRHYTVMAATTYSPSHLHLLPSPLFPPFLLPSTLLLLLLLSGDIETNPGPPTGRLSVAKGPSTEEQVYTLNAQVMKLEYLFLGIFDNILKYFRLKTLKQSWKMLNWS